MLYCVHSRKNEEEDLKMTKFLAVILALSMMLSLAAAAGICG